MPVHCWWMVSERRNNYKMTQLNSNTHTCAELSMLSARRWSSCSVFQPDGIHDCYGINRCSQMLCWRHFGEVFRSTVVSTVTIIPSYIFVHPSINCFIKSKCNKISPVGDWRSTFLEWPWPWFRTYGIPSCITHRPLPTYQISLRLEENFFWKSSLRFWSSSESRDTKTRTNIKNPAQSNLDIVL